MRWTTFSTIYLAITLALIPWLMLAILTNADSWLFMTSLLMAFFVVLLIMELRKPFQCVDLCPECGHCEYVHAIDKDPMDPDATVFCMANLGVGTASAGQCRCER